MRGSLRKRIESKVWRRRSNSCWPWLAHLDKEGYARIWVNNEIGSTLAHSVLYALNNGPPPAGFVVLTCPLLKDCMNPDHLGIGHSEDVGDRILWKKGLERLTQRKREKPRKLTDGQVRSIFSSTESTSTLAEQYKVTPSTISNIRAGRMYKRITQGEQDEHSVQDSFGRNADGSRDCP